MLKEKSSGSDGGFRQFLFHVPGKSNVFGVSGSSILLSGNIRFGLEMMEEEAEEDLMFEISSPEDVKPRFQYMEKLIVASTAINMWPKPKKTNSVLYHAKFCVVLFICLSIILSFGLKVVIEFRNMDSITALIDFLTVFISGLFRYIYVYMRGDRLVYLVSLVHGNFIHYPIVPNGRRMSLDSYYELAIKLILVYATFTFIWIIQMCMTPAVGYVWARAHLPPNETIPYPIPYDVYIPFDYQKQPPWVIAAVYIYQTIGYLTFGWIYVVVDSFWYMVILLTIGQFVLIEDSLKTITEVLKKAEEEGHSLEEGQIRKVECGLKRCVAQHQFVKGFVRMIDDLSNQIILVDCMHAMISIAFVLLDMTISLNNGTWRRVLYILEYFIASITHLFFFDWLGNELAERENELGNTIYDFPWYKFPSQKTTFLLMTVQARKPFKLTGGKMYNLSLQCFAKMSRVIFSYFTFLFQVRNEK